MLAKRLRVFNGVKAISIVYAMLGISFLFSWYSVISSPQEVEKKKMSYAFTIVYGSIYTTPVLFMTAGFLQAHSFLQGDPEKAFSVGNVGKYLLWRYTKFMVIEAAALLFGMYLMQPLGSGPVWPTYQTVIAPCN